MEPFVFEGEPGMAWEALRASVRDEPRVNVVLDDGARMKFEARSLIFRFVDDVEFLLDPSASLIHVRSASRTGYGDFGVNRKRVERLRATFDAALAP